MQELGTDLIEGSLSILFRDNDKLNFKIEWTEIKRISIVVYDILNEEKVETNRTENKELLFQKLHFIEENTLNKFYQSLLNRQYNMKDRFFLGLQPFYEQLKNRN